VVLAAAEELGNRPSAAARAQRGRPSCALRTVSARTGAPAQRTEPARRPLARLRAAGRARSVAWVAEEEAAPVQPQHAKRRMMPELARRVVSSYAPQWRIARRATSV
jgi:hypothetical protein